MLDHIVDHAAHPPTLADIVRDTGLPRATVHAIVAELCDAGWLTRRSDDGTVRLGPGFLTTARAASLTDPLAVEAGHALDRLVADTGAPAFLARRIDEDTITVIDYRRPAHLSTAPPREEEWMRPGRPIRLRPPIGREFLAWSDDDVRERWIELAPEADRPRLRSVLAEVRSRGYSIERITDGHRAVIDALSDLTSVPSDLRAKVGGLLSELSVVDYLPDELSDDTEAGAVTVGAPIHHDGRVVGALVSCPHTTMSGRRLREWGTRTMEAARAVGD